MARKKKKPAARKRPAKKAALKAKPKQRPFDPIADGYFVAKLDAEQPEVYSENDFEAGFTSIHNARRDNKIVAHVFKTKEAARSFLREHLDKESFGQVPEGATITYVGATVVPVKKFFDWEYCWEGCAIERRVVLAEYAYPLAKLLKVTTKEFDGEFRDLEKEKKALQKDFDRNMKSCARDYSRIAAEHDRFLKAVDTFNGKHF